MIINAIKCIGSKTAPNPIEIDYWIDTASNPYGADIKYHNGVDWVNLFKHDNDIDLTDYYTKQQVELKLITKADIDTVTNLFNVLDNNKANKTSVYTKDQIDASLLNFATKDYVVEEIAKASLDEPIDLTGYATESWVEKKIAEAEFNDPDIDVSVLATKSELSAVEAKIPSIEGLLKSSEAAETYQPKGDYALKSDVPSIDGLASETYVNEQISKIEIPSTESLATKDEVKAVEDKIPSIDGLATEKYVDDAISAIEHPTVDLTGYATEEWVEGKGYLTEHQDISTLATKTYVDQGIADLINGAPETLDTLKEISDAIKTNDDVVSALNSAIGNKVNKSDLANVALSGSYDDLSSKPNIPYPDEEDITLKNVEGSNVLSFNNKTYDQNNHTGVGRKYLRKNIINGVNTLTQDMFDVDNTRYIIQYDYDLNSVSITIPKGCILDFQGGCFRNGELKFSSTCLMGIPQFRNILGSGRIQNHSLDVSCFGVYTGSSSIPVTSADCSSNLQDAINFAESIGGLLLTMASGIYNLNKSIQIKEGVILQGAGRNLTTIYASEKITSGYLIEIGKIQQGGLRHLTIQGRLGIPYGSSDSAGTTNNWANYSGIKIGNSDTSTATASYGNPLYDCMIRWFPKNGVECYNNQWVYMIDNCIIQSCGKAALYADCDDNLFSNLWLSGSDYGLYLIGSSNKFNNIKIDNLTKYSGTSYGIYASSMINSCFSNIEVQWFPLGGYLFEGCSNILFSNTYASVSGQSSTWQDIEEPVFHFKNSNCINGLINIAYDAYTKRNVDIRVENSSYVNLQASAGQTHRNLSIENISSENCAITEYKLAQHNNNNLLYTGAFRMKNMLDDIPSIITSSATYTRTNLKTIVGEITAQNGYLNFNLNSELKSNHTYIISVKLSSTRLVYCQLFGDQVNLVSFQHGATDLNDTYVSTFFTAEKDYSVGQFRIAYYNNTTDVVIQDIHIVDVTEPLKCLPKAQIKEFIIASDSKTDVNIDSINSTMEQNLSRVYIPDNLIYLKNKSYASFKINDMHFIVTEPIDLRGLTYTLGDNCTIQFIGCGKFYNGTLNLNGAKILPSYNELINDDLTITGTPAKGTYYFNNSPTWYDGNSWVGFN